MTPEDKLGQAALKLTGVVLIWAACIGSVALQSPSAAIVFVALTGVGFIVRAWIDQWRGGGK